jgi:hypothetical protein
VIAIRLIIPLSEVSQIGRRIHEDSAVLVQLHPLTLYDRVLYMQGGRS